MEYPMVCDTCGTQGTEDDLIEIGGECAHEECSGTIIRNGPATVEVLLREAQSWVDCDHPLWFEIEGALKETEESE